MQILPKEDNSSERLHLSEGSLGYDEIIREHIFPYRNELQEVTSALNAMRNKDSSNDHIKNTAEEWALRSNMIGKITGVDTGLSFEETSKAYTEKSKIKDIDKFGDLRKFDIKQNEDFLNSVANNEVIDTEKEQTDTMLVQAQSLVNELALENPIKDRRFEAENENFALAA